MSTLGMVPVGAVITRSYYAVPGHYGTGEEYATFREAAEAAYAKGQAIRDQIEADPGSKPYYSEETLESLAKVASSVDLRWTLRYPDGGGLDTVAERTNVRHLGPEHWARLDKMGVGVGR